jgi:hypothetical protein
VTAGRRLRCALSALRSIGVNAGGPNIIIGELTETNLIVGNVKAFVALHTGVSRHAKHESHTKMARCSKTAR